MDNYRALNERLFQVTKNVSEPITNLANAVAVIKEEVPSVNWVGVYLKKGDNLILGPFQGKPGCPLVPVGKDICGIVAKQNDVMIVPNVHYYTDHVLFDKQSFAEIALPIHKNGRLYGVLVVDSIFANFFSLGDKFGLTEFVKILEKLI